MIGIYISFTKVFAYEIYKFLYYTYIYKFNLDIIIIHAMVLWNIINNSYTKKSIWKAKMATYGDKKMYYKIGEEVVGMSEN